MKIVYHCRTGSQSAPVAAAIHLGSLPAAGRPTALEIAAVPFFGGLGLDDRGFLHRCGRDQSGREVYVAGRGGAAVLVERAARAAASLAGQDAEDIVFVDCSHVSGLWGTCAGCIWQHLYGPGRGRLFLARSIVRCYPGLAALVLSVRGQAAR